MKTTEDQWIEVVNRTLTLGDIVIKTEEHMWKPVRASISRNGAYIYPIITYFPHEDWKATLTEIAELLNRRNWSHNNRGFEYTLGQYRATISGNKVLIFHNEVNISTHTIVNASLTQLADCAESSIKELSLDLTTLTSATLENMYYNLVKACAKCFKKSNTMIDCGVCPNIIRGIHMSAEHMIGELRKEILSRMNGGENA